MPVAEHARRPAGSRWPPRASSTRGTPRRRCARSAARWRAPGCSRSTRSTCCSGRTTCRCSRGWAPTTPTLLHRAAEKTAAAGGGVLGARPGVHAGRAVAGHAAPDGALPRRSGASGGRRSDDDRRSWRRCSPRSPSAGRRTARDLDDGAAARQGPLGLELVRDQARRWSTSTWPATLADRRAQQPVRGALRPAGAGDPGRGPGAAPTPTRRGGRPRAGPPGGGLARGRRRVQCLRRLLPDAQTDAR